MINQVAVGHCLEVLKRIPDKSVHCCVTSPPYYGLRDYGLAPALWPEVLFSPMPGLPPLYVPEQEYCLGLEKDIWAYVGHMVAVFREVKRVMRDDGTLWLNLGDSYQSSNSQQVTQTKDIGTSRVAVDKRPPTQQSLKPKDLMGIPWRVALALQADGWYLRSDVIWHKPNPMPESVTDRPTKAHEYVFLMSKSERYFYDTDAIREPHSRQWWNETVGPEYMTSQDGRNDGGKRKGNGTETGRNRRTVWTVATQPYSNAHFATFPPKLIEPMILASTSEYGVCGNCGAQWVREVEKGFTDHTGQTDSQYQEGTTANRLAKLRQAARERGQEYTNQKITTGWRPSCSCNASVAPAVILDPFGGSGTTGKVALANRHNFILIDANPVYAEELATERLNGTQIKLV